ncbi:MAG: lamin tail domain-containing protein, partial [Verrucomicrobiales bacterium]
MTLKAGTIFSPRDIYFTTDGTDPRAMGGDLAPTATLSVNSITVDETMRVRARVLNGNTWSGLVENWYFVSETPASAANLQISKIHYHPSDPTEEEIAAGFLDGDDFEFLELRNTSDQAVHFGGARFSDGIEFTFDDPSILQSQERLLLVSDRQAFEARYGNELDLTGEYAGNLRNSGERLQLLDFKGEAIIDLTYNDLGSWPRSADGDGPSLVRLDETSDGPFAWRPSVLEDGAPGVDDGITFDRLSNWIEFALGRSPALTVEASEEFLVVRHPRNLAAKGVQVLLEGSEDLIEWQTIPEPKPIDRIYIEDNLVQESLEVSKTRQLHYLR